MLWSPQCTGGNTWYLTLASKKCYGRSQNLNSPNWEKITAQQVSNKGSGQNTSSN